MSQEIDIDYWRQLDIFSPRKFKTPVTVIGAGATGSYVVWLLAKMGCRDITVYDFDKVENHNLPNQVFGPADIGKTKVAALAELIERETGAKIKAVPKKFEKGELQGIVFVLTDSMSSRAKIWKTSVKNRLGVDLLIETRLAAEGGLVYALKPARPSHVDAYERTLYSDAEAEESPCTRRAVAPAAATIAGLAVFTLIDFAAGKPIANEVLFSLSPMLLRTKKF